MLVDRLTFNLQQVALYRDSADYRNDVQAKLNKLNLYIDELSEAAGVVPGNWKKDLTAERFTPEIQKETRIWLESLKTIFADLQKQAMIAENGVSNSLEAKLGSKGLVALREDYENKWLRSLVLNHDQKEVIYETDEKIIRKFEPAYMKATSPYGRAHYYAPVKTIGNIEIDTWWFNVIFIWIVSAVFYLVLYNNLIRKLLEYMENLRLPKADV